MRGSLCRPAAALAAHGAGHRKTQIQQRQREANRLHKALEHTGMKLDSVATDILGQSGRAMLDALVAGTADPAVLAKPAKGRLRGKLPQLREVLDGRFGSHHALVIGAIIAHLDFLDEHIERLSDAIEEQLGPFAPGIPLTATVTGVAARTAQTMPTGFGSSCRVRRQVGSLRSLDRHLVVDRFELPLPAAGAVLDGVAPALPVGPSSRYGIRSRTMW